jgi:murein DD-endopeptidase MepM/ murein hydrolase activator NlpD
MQIKQIHNRWSFWQHHFPRHQLLAAIAISLGMVLVLGLLPDNVVANRAMSLATDKNEARTSYTPAFTTEVNPPAVEKDPWVHLTINKGDTLSSILQEQGVSAADVHAIANKSKHSKELAALKLGDQLDILIQNGNLQELQLQRSKLEKVSVVKNGDHYETDLLIKTPEIRENFAVGNIESSLFLAGQRAGLDDRMILKLADIFAYDIDFMLDLQEGDTFSVLYEELYTDGEHVGKGKILAAEFINNGKKHHAVLYTAKDGSQRYYSPSGELLRKQFLRTPVDFAKITSYFSLSRKHPILHKIRAHKGIDYGAPRGTPIRSAGDGKVVFAGKRNGFGNTVMVQHGSVYTTLYGHMDRISVKNGTRVQQGQIIGTVGSTGLATGPHLHYEFHVNGTPQNPLANKNMAMAEPLSKSERANFDSSASPLLNKLKQRLATTNKLQQLAEASTPVEQPVKR